MATYRPLGNRVLVKRSKAEKTKGGILLPESAQEKPKQGTVISVGPGKSDDNGQISPMTVKANDEVLFSSYAGTPVKDDDKSGEELLIMSEDEILGIIA